MERASSIASNLARCIDSALAGEEVVSHYPVDLVVQVTTRCCINPPCLICDRNMRPAEAEADLDPRLLPKLAELLGYADRVFLFSGGEPLLAPQFFAIAGLVRCPSKIRINTNALLLNETNVRRIVDNGCFEVVNVSLDAATPETYRRMRHHDFGKTIANVKALVRYREEQGAKWPHVFLNMAICKSNVEEVSLLPLVAADIGAVAVDYSRLNEGLDFTVATATGQFTYRDEMVYDRGRYDELLLVAADRCRELNIRAIFFGAPFYSASIRRPDILEDRRFPGTVDALLAGGDPYLQVDAPIRGDSNCCFPWTQAVVASNGDVTTCCFHDTRTGGLGNLLDKDFRRVWNSLQAQRIRRQMHLRRRSDACAMHCRYLRGAP